jgi:DNA polymerase III alpha subunit
MRYVEFAATSNFTFLRGASHPEELGAQAARLGLAGLGLSDRNSVAGVVRAHVARRESGLTLAYHPGARLVFADGTADILAWPRDRAAWGRLCRLLTLGNRRAAKGDCILYRDDLLAHVDGLELVVMDESSSPSPRLRGEGGERSEPGEGLRLQTQTHGDSSSPAPDPAAQQGDPDPHAALRRPTSPR